VDSEGSEFLVNDDGDSKVILPKANWQNLKLLRKLAFIIPRISQKKKNNLKTMCIIKFLKTKLLVWIF
jgi:hypothetical protein